MPVSNHLQLKKSVDVMNMDEFRGSFTLHSLSQWILAVDFGCKLTWLEKKSQRLPGEYLLRWVNGVLMVYFGGPVIPNLSRWPWMSRVSTSSKQKTWFRFTWKSTIKRQEMNRTWGSTIIWTDSGEYFKFSGSPKHPETDRNYHETLTKPPQKNGTPCPYQHD